jgi:hypothetical protein
MGREEYKLTRLRSKKMKRFVYILFTLLMAAGTVAAQPQDRIHAVKAAYITDRVGLSSDQAARFWPVYKEYENEMMRLRKSGDEYSDDIERQEAFLQVRKRYRNEFLKIISPDQLNSLYGAEREFRQMLIRELKDRRGGGGPPPGRGRGPRMR